jgi:K+-transporting ATPase ATPase B chain
MCTVNALFVHFTAQTRMSGVDLKAARGHSPETAQGRGRSVRKHVEALGGSVS